MKYAMLGRFAVSALLIAAPLGIASAADMPVKAPMKAAAPIPYSWNGFYIGINGGGASGNTSWDYLTATLAPTPAFANHDSSGGMVGGTVGFNWQAPGSHWVAGVEADWDWAQINGSTSCPNPFFSCQSKIRDIGTARARLGWAEDRILFYVTGGAAWGDVRIQTVQLNGIGVPPTGTPTNGTSSTRMGWTAGGGVEANVPGTFLTAKLEVLYYDLGANNYTVDFLLPVRARENGTMIRAGFNWNFGPH